METRRMSDSGEAFLQVCHGNRSGAEQGSQLPGARLGPAGDTDPGDAGTDQAAGSQFGHLARAQQQDRFALETPEDLARQLHGHGAHRDRGLGDSGYRSGPVWRLETPMGGAPSAPFPRLPPDSLRRTPVSIVPGSGPLPEPWSRGCWRPGTRARPLPALSGCTDNVPASRAPASDSGAGIP